MTHDIDDPGARFLFRPLRPEDVGAVVELWKLCGLPYRPTGRDAPALLAEQIAAATDLFLGVFDGTRLIGTSFGSLDGRQKGWINRVAVDPRFRRHGLASALVERTEATLRARGCMVTAVLIEAHNDTSLALFDKLGFDRTEVIYLQKANQEGA